MNTFTSTRKIRTESEIEAAYEASEAYKKMMKASETLRKAYADVTITPAQIKELETIADKAKKTNDVFFFAIVNK